MPCALCFVPAGVKRRKQEQKEHTPGKTAKQEIVGTCRNQFIGELRQLINEGECFHVIHWICLIYLARNGTRNPLSFNAVWENVDKHREDACYLWYDLLDILDFTAPNYQSWIDEINTQIKTHRTHLFYNPSSRPTSYQ